MRDKTSSSEAAWQEEELSAAALPDKRLARRLRRLLDQMSVSCAGQANPGGLRRLGGGEGGLPLL
ncbi:MULTISPECIES: transposase DNA-binding-containing protein [Mesorhizobium]|uniref:transposase DNA-binding-containing protein n=1 Tax=Mesorhizobium TaxID=68287 RepID=UPI000381B052|nr:MULTISPECIES: transposase DNA-binding-containing protein [Mesorhizobium]